MENRKKLEILAKKIRLETIKEIGAIGAGHVGGSMSIADLLAVLYGSEMRYDPKNPRWEDRDWLIVSKGHSGPAVYATLALEGFFDMDMLKTLNQPGTNLPSHCDRNKTPGVDLTTGSLGQGISGAVGVAKAHKILGKSNTIYAILGDGECDEGQVWEAVMFAAQHALDNLIVFIDYNKEQIDGTTAQVMDLDFEGLFKALKWHVLRTDGHDVVKLQETIRAAKANKGAPTVVVLDTVKGKDCLCAEGRPNHHMHLTQEQVTTSVARLEEELARMEAEGKGA